MQHCIPKPQPKPIPPSTPSTCKEWGVYPKCPGFNHCKYYQPGCDCTTSYYDCPERSSSQVVEIIQHTKNQKRKQILESTPCTCNTTKIPFC